MCVCVCVCVCEGENAEMRSTSFRLLGHRKLELNFGGCNLLNVFVLCVHAYEIHRVFSTSGPQSLAERLTKPTSSTFGSDFARS